MDDETFPVVGIGASAGGIIALRVLLEAIPPRPGLAFVVVQHTLSARSSELAKLMSRWTPLPVQEALEGTRLERGRVYVAPPGVMLSLHQRVFANQRLEPATPRTGVHTIDAFFESLARELGSRARAVVLSGTGVDGAAGAVRIKQAGGMVFVQDPTTALHDGMPTAAVANGAADHIMPLLPMAQELVASASPSYVRSPSGASWSDDATEALEGIFAGIRAKAGLDLTGYKTTPLLWGIQHRMDVRRVPLFRDYEALLHDDPAELETLVRGIPIHVTEFFRDPGAWQVLQRDVIPLLFRGDAPIRAWTAACATGEEAYSLAMLLAEHAEALDSPIDFRVFATDTSAEIVARASRGVFKPENATTLPPERRHRFFYAADGAVRVKRSLREKMVFAPHDLLADPPFTGLDLVSCRNLLIHLEPDAAKRVIFLLHASLRMGGYLFLGRAESLPRKQRGFEEVAPGALLYRKVGRAAPADVEFPKRPARLRSRRSSSSIVEAHTHHEAVQRQEMPAVLVDEQFHVLRFYGDTSPFVRFRPGEPTLDLMQLLHPKLAADLAYAARQARSQDRAVPVDELPDPVTGGLTLGMRVTPLRTPEEGDTRLLVSFVCRAAEAEVRSDAATAAATAEAIDWSEALRLSHEELESSREELQALNEELRASNNQLNFAIEDLHRANTLLQEKIEALETQSNVLSSGAVMTILLDRDLRVRWFTPAMVDLFPLRAHDVGRRITDLVPMFSAPRLLDHVDVVMRTGEPYESEVRGTSERWYLLRIHPATGNGSGRDAGVAMTFADITDLKRAEQALREREAWLAGQKEAFQAAIDGTSLASSLDALIRTAMEQMEDGPRAAFYLADARGASLHHVEGTPEAQARCINSFPIGADSFACGLAASTGRPVITPDVLDDPRWSGSLELARELDLRACWSFPIETAAGRVVGTLAMYHPRPRNASLRDLELAAVLTRAAAIIISHHQQAEQRERTVGALQLSEEHLQLAAAATQFGTFIWHVEEGRVAFEGNPPVARRMARTALDLTHRQAIEERQAFLLQLSDALRPLGDPGEIQRTAAEALGRHLGAGRCGYGEVDETGELITFTHDWTNGVMKSLSRTVRLDDFGPIALEINAGRTVRLEAPSTDGRTRGTEATHVDVVEVRRDVGVLMVKNGRLVAAFSVHHTEPRRWSDAEVALAEETTERTWSAVAHARAEDAATQRGAPGIPARAERRAPAAR